MSQRMTGCRVMTKAGGFGAPDLLQHLHRTFH